MGFRFDPFTGQLKQFGVTEQELAAELQQQRGEIQTSLSQELQAAVQRVEGTASVATTAAVTLPAGSTGPVAVSLADPEFLGTETSIKGLLGTVYGVLARAADGSYSFTSEQTYTGAVTLGAGTIFAAAHLPNTLNPLRVGQAELQEDLSYADTGYAYVMLDASGRVAWGVKADGTFYAEKNNGSFSGTFAGTLTGNVIGNVTGDVTGNVTGDVDADEIRVNKLIAPGGTIDLDSADTQLLNILQGGAQSGDPAYGEFYAHVVLDANDRIAYGVRPDGSVAFTRQIAGEAETAAKLTPLGDNEIEEDTAYDFFAHVELDSANRISRAVRLSGEHYFPKADIDQLNVKSFTVDGQPLAVRPDSLAGGLLGLFESRSDGTSYQIYRYFNGAESQLTAGSNNYNISLTSETPERVLFYSDRDGSQSAYVMNADGSDVYYANALSKIAIWGDSMSADLGESAIRAGLATVGASEPSRNVWNLGIGGQSSLQVALRMGALPWTAEIVGGEIPASGQVQITNHRTPLLSAFNQQYGLPGDNVLDYGSWNGGSYKDTYVEINGVKGQIFRTDATTNPDTYVFQRTTAGDAVTVANPVSIKVVEQALPFIGYGTPVSATTIASYTSILWPFGPHTTNNIQVNGVNVADVATADLEMDVVAAMVAELGSLNKKFLLLYDVTGHPAPSDSINDLRGRFVGNATKNAYATNYPDRYFDPYPFVINGGLGVPSFKAWFAANYPSQYATDWTAPLTANVYTEPKAAATVTLTGNGGGGVTQNHTSVETTSPPDTSYAVEIRDQTRRGLKVGVVASGGVVTSLWVREGGIGYAVGDTFTIPAGTIGNTSDITGTVASIQSEVIGTVRNQDGSVDVASSYSQWDVDNGWFPRSARRDVVHFNTVGAEYFCLLLAAKLKSLNW